MDIRAAFIFLVTVSNAGKRLSFQASALKLGRVPLDGNCSLMLILCLLLENKICYSIVLYNKLYYTNS